MFPQIWKLHLRKAGWLKTHWNWRQTKRETEWRKQKKSDEEDEALTISECVIISLVIMSSHGSEVD